MRRPAAVIEVNGRRLDDTRPVLFCAHIHTPPCTYDAVPLLDAWPRFGYPPLSAADDVDPKVATIMADTIGVDTHNHIDVPLVAADGPGPDLDIVGELKRSGLSAVCATFAVDYQKLDKAGVAHDRFVSGLTAMDAQHARTKVKRALNLKDLQDAHKRREPIVIQAVEGGHFLEGKLERVEEAYKRGAPGARAPSQNQFPFTHAAVGVFQRFLLRGPNSVRLSR